MLQQDIGIIGMATMGCNLAINIEKHGYGVSIFNRSKEKTNQVIVNNPGKKIIPYYNIQEFIYSLRKPRVILLMIRSGEGVDQMINLMKPFLEKKDTIVDGGNSFYKDTIRRNNVLLKDGFNFVGAGISGGAEGALNGPAIMLGGDINICKSIIIMMQDIVAYSNNEACITCVGPDGSGHYVKMVHNGIEYGDMQLIAETYSLLKNILKLNNNQLSEIFNDWNQGELNSYLIEISATIIRQKDEQGNFLLDFILDIAENKGTGAWNSKDALDLGEPLSLITESVFARYISSIKNQRTDASKILLGPIANNFNTNKLEFIEELRRALYLSKIISYAQGFSQLKSASHKNNWNLNYSKIAKVFRAGCIIRAKLLQNIADVYEDNIKINNLLLSPYFQNIANSYQQSLRKIVSCAIIQGIPIPAFSAAITYYDSYRNLSLPTNLIQAQRDYFGAHTYKRIDQKGKFHTLWNN